ncbi:MAG: family 43 glycosylhydrolase [Proteobacteria bacterium]|nr:family 43 glycosylhydrolase [Pseudomonadota bacterium]
MNQMFRFAMLLSALTLLGLNGCDSDAGSESPDSVNSCTDDCNPGDKKCDGNALYVCGKGEDSIDACYTWGLKEACSNDKICDEKKYECVAKCTENCNEHPEPWDDHKEPPVPKPTCGNGQLDEGEICDGDQLSPESACPSGTSLLEGQSLSCRADCTLNTSNCHEPCGNGQIDEGEICDGELLSSEAACPSGTSLLKGQTLGCNADCTLNTTNCHEPCGNGQIDEGEICDGDLLSLKAACPSGTSLLKGQTLGCNADCTLNTTNCHESCGNGQLDEGEICDGELLSLEAACPSETSLLDGQSLSCHKDCTLDTTNCEPCRTTITYGNSWLRAEGHSDDFDIVEGKVTWDGSCTETTDGNSFAALSNGWKPHFKNYDCLMALDYTKACKDVPSACETRVSYSEKWYKAHDDYYDDVKGVVTWDGICSDVSGGDTYAQLSNGWKPGFKGACEMSFRYLQCGGLFANPVIASDAPDPGAIWVDGTYYVATTPGPNGYQIFKSEELHTLKHVKDVNMKKPNHNGWAGGGTWAPEIHRVGKKFHLYYSANQKSDDTIGKPGERFCVGVAIADAPDGDYKDRGTPLVCAGDSDAAYERVIDASYFQDADGKHYVLWQQNGNRNNPSKIYIQQLDVKEDGAVVDLMNGTKPVKLIESDQDWEMYDVVNRRGVVEGPWLIRNGKYYYLFYSGNTYDGRKYAVGVARATAITGPYQKHDGPVMASRHTHFTSPGHGSVLKSPEGTWFHIYHAWKNNQRMVLVDRIQWIDDWPYSLSAPMYRSQPPIR